MRAISSKEYAEVVEDTICGRLEDAVGYSFEFIFRELGIAPDYDERQVLLQSAMDSFQCDIEATWRDQMIELFESYGLDVESDGREW